MLLSHTQYCVEKADICFLHILTYNKVNISYINDILRELTH